MIKMRFNKILSTKSSNQIFLNSSVHGSHGKYNITTLKIPLLAHLYTFFAVQFVCSINTTWKCSLIFLTTHAVHLVTWLASFFCNFFFYILHLTHIAHLQADQLNNQPPIRLFTPDCISLLLRYGHNCDASDFKFLFCCLFSISAFEVAIWNVISGIRYTG